MSELFSLGTNITIPADNMTVDNVIDDLSDTSTEMLCFIAEELSMNNPDNEFGICLHHHFDSCGLNWNTKDLDNLIESGLITLHHSSGNGIAFAHCNEDVFNSLVEFGEIIPFSEDDTDL